MITINICILIAFVLCFCIAVVAWVHYLTHKEVRNIMQHVEQLSAKPRKVSLKADRLDDYFDELDDYFDEPIHRREEEVRRHDKHRKYR